MIYVVKVKWAPAQPASLARKLITELKRRGALWTMPYDINDKERWPAAMPLDVLYAGMPSRKDAQDAKLWLNAYRPKRRGWRVEVWHVDGHGEAEEL